MRNLDVCQVKKHNIIAKVLKFFDIFWLNKFLWQQRGDSIFMRRTSWQEQMAEKIAAKKCLAGKKKKTPPLFARFLTLFKEKSF